jgi:hypothetical protein
MSRPQVLRSFPEKKCGDIRHWGMREQRSLKISPGFVMDLSFMTMAGAQGLLRFHTSKLNGADAV